MPALRWLVGAVLLCLGLGLVALWRTHGVEPDPRSPQVGTSGQSHPLPDAVNPGPVPDPEASRTVVAVGDEEAARSASSASAPEVRVLVEGEVQGTAEDEPVQVAVSIFGEPGADVLRGSFAGGRFELDASAFHEPLEQGQSLSVQVSRTHGPPLDLGPLRLADAVRGPPGAEHVLRLRALGRWPAGGIRALVQDVAAAPLAGVRAALFLEGGDVPEHVLSGASDSRGRVWLLPPGEASGWLVLWADGLQVRSVPVDWAPGTTTDLGALRLSEGESIAGIVLDPDGDPAPGYNCWLATSTPGSTRIQVGESVLSWSGREWDVAIRRMETDEKGRFDFGGLQPAAYEVASDGPLGRLITGPGEPLPVMATDRSVVLQLTRCLIRLLVRGGEEPILGARISIEGQSHAWSDQHGRALVMYPQGEAFTLDVEKEGYESESIALIARDQTVEVSLDPLPRPGSLHFQVVDEDGAPVPEISLAWQRVGSTATYHDHRRSSAGEYAVQRLLPGDHLLRIRRGRWSDHGTYSTEAALLLAVDGEERLGRIVVPLGGRLRLRIHDGQGSNLPATCRLLREGAPASIEFEEYPAGRLRTDGLVPHGRDPDEDAYADVVPSLEEGTWKIHAELQGHAPAAVEVVLEKGKLTVVEIELKEG